jgi:hypothetical protein
MKPLIITTGLLIAAIVRIGAGKPLQWKSIRVGGRTNEWTEQGVMAIDGAAGSSAGFQANVAAGVGNFSRV